MRNNVDLVGKRVVSARAPALPERAASFALGPWVGVGAVVFGVGLLASLVTLVPLFLDSEPMPTAVQLLTALAPVGAAIALFGLVRASRADTRARPANLPVRNP